MTACQKYIGGEFLEVLKKHCEEILGTEEPWSLEGVSTGILRYVTHPSGDSSEIAAGASSPRMSPTELDSRIPRLVLWRSPRSPFLDREDEAAKDCPPTSGLPTNRPRNDIPPPLAIICAAFRWGESIGEDLPRWHQSQLQKHAYSEQKQSIPVASPLL